MLNNKAAIIDTDTVYGIISTNKKLIEKIKNRTHNQKPIIRFIYDVSQMGKNIPEDLLNICKNFWPGPLTIIWKKNSYRIPRHSILLKVIQKLDIPVYASSANITGKSVIKNIEEGKKIFNQFKDQIGFFETKNNSLNLKASTIFNYDSTEVIREGEIKGSEILNLVRKN